MLPAVAPCVGAWIETGTLQGIGTVEAESLPAWERGLKLRFETSHSDNGLVAPCVGAWIETAISLTMTSFLMSLPAWERGLKPTMLVSLPAAEIVAPCVGAWIETDLSGKRFC